MADFTTSYIDGAPNSPVSVQNPVVDQSSSIGYDFLNSIVRSGGSIAADFIEGRQKLEQEAAVNSAVANFATTQLKLADAVEQGQMTSQEARMRMRSNYTQAVANNPALAGDLAKAQRDIVKNTGFGKVVEEGTEEEKIQLAAEKEATLNGWVPAGIKGPEKERAVQSYLQFKKAQDMLRDEQARVNLETSYITQETAKISQGTARINQQSARLTLVEKEQAQRSRVALGSMADAYNYKLATDLNAIQQKVENGEISREEGIMLADQQYAIIQQLASSVGANAGSDYVNNLTAPMRLRYENTKKFLSGEVTAEVLGRQNEVALGLQKANILGDPNVAKVIATSQLFPHASPELLATIDTAVVQTMGRQTKEDGMPVNLTSDDEEDKPTTQGYLNLLKDSLKTINSGTYYTDDKEEVDKQVGINIRNVLKGIDAYSMATTNPASYNQVVDFLASDEFGKYAASKGGAIPADTAHNAKAVLNQQYEQQVLPLLRKEWENANIGVGFNPGRGAPQIKQATEVIKPLFTGAGISFVVNPEYAKSSVARARAKDLNDKVAPVVNRLIRLTAHMNGDQNYKAAYEAKYVEIFGEEQPQEEVEE